MKKKMLKKRLEDILVMTRAAREEKKEKSVQKIVPKELERMARAAVHCHLPILLESMEHKAKFSENYVFVEIPVPRRLRHPSLVRKYCKAYTLMVAKTLGRPFQVDHTVDFGRDFRLSIEWPW